MMSMTRCMVVTMSARMVHAMPRIAVVGMTTTMMMVMVIAGAQAHKTGNGNEGNDDFLVHGVF